jgi:hypothetical protein
LQMQACGHLIRVPKVRVLNYTRPEILAWNKHSSFMNPFVSCEK